MLRRFTIAPFVFSFLLLSLSLRAANGDTPPVFADPGLQKAFWFLNDALSEGDFEEIRFGIWRIEFQLRRCETLYGTSMTDRFRKRAAPLIERADSVAEPTPPRKSLSAPDGFGKGREETNVRLQTSLTGN